MRGQCSVPRGPRNEHPYLEFLIFGLLQHAEGPLVGGLELGLHGLVLLSGLPELALQLLPLVVRELLQLPQVLLVVAGALLQGLLHLGDLPAGQLPSARLLPPQGVLKHASFPNVSSAQAQRGLLCSSEL